ncbi:BamA/OMP85 family outer membrane protein [Candidatus Similichlamydia epinepheli]|uniref:BamA/OMP85 family outer membrane protein n=1 Tax=Candidatus Similichlamydia epinepheli TaxID=1903953 RepID=UPI000D3A7BCE|nr:POTRA domain-containing protein [Candidatus Similichlamydia epinepheli]
MLKLLSLKNYFACLFLVCISGVLVASEFKISSIKLKGVDDCCSEDEMSSYLSEMNSKPGERFDPVVLNDDIKKLSSVFEKLIPEFFVNEDGLSIVFQGKLRPFIRSVRGTISGNREQFSKEEFDKQFPVKEGDRFDKNKLLWESRKVVKYLQSRGYLNAKVEISETPVGEEAVDLFVKVNLGTFYYIRSIKVIGLHDRYLSAFSSIRLSQKYDPFSSFLFHIGLYDQRKAEQDRINLLSILKNDGYSDAQVILHPFEYQDSGAITLVFEVLQGSKYSIRNVQLPSDDPFNVNDLLKCFGVSPGRVFSPEAIRLAVSSIETLYGSHGFVESEVHIDQILTGEEDLTFDLTVLIDPKEKLRIGDISIRGNVLTDPNFIMDQCPLAKMDYFDVSEMKRLEATLMQSGLFEYVRIFASREPFQEDPFLRELIIEVREQPTGTLSVAFTYASESSWKGTCEIRDRHFNAMGLLSVGEKGITALRGQGETVGLKLSAGRQFFDIQGDFFKPLLFRSKWGYGFDFIIQQSFSPSENVRITKKTFSNRFSRMLGNHTSVSFQHRAGSVQSFLDDSEEEEEASDLVRREIESDFFVQGFGAQLALDHTVGYGFYLSGWKASFLGEVLFTSSQHLRSHVAGKLYADASAYVPCMKGVFKLSGSFSTLSLMKGSFDDFPYPERIFTDHLTTPRGWRERSLGLTIVDEDNIVTSYPKGGDCLLACSSEYNVPINEGLSVFTFSDFSYLSLGGSTMTPVRIGQLQTSIGYGIRVRSFMGMPLAVGFGYPLIQSGRTSDLSNFFFSLGNSF